MIDTEEIARHPHDGRVCCRQATESVGDFLNRLPPNTTRLPDIGPWIFIADRRLLSPELFDVQTFEVEARKLLVAFKEELEEIELGDRATSAAGKVALARKINTKRQKLESNILQIACDQGVTTGKWMLFLSPEKVDDVWAVVARATSKGELGISAKVATQNSQNEKASRLICIYTKDYRDKEDIQRVLLKLADMSIVSKAKGARPIYYKCDAYTYLDIMTGNPWGLKPSMYSSATVFGDKW